jgi:hypothetical protein
VGSGRVPEPTIVGTQVGFHRVKHGQGLLHSSLQAERTSLLSPENQASGGRTSRHRRSGGESAVRRVEVVEVPGFDHLLVDLERARPA